jgi:MurNAc alpha-1-phosphate uridylyltransferase
LNDEVFVLMNVDILTDLDLNTMVAYHKKMDPLATLATTMRKTSRYFLFDNEDNLCGWRNTKTGEEKMIRASHNPSARAFSGIHVINPRIFNLIKTEGKFSIVDLYLALAREEVIKSFDHSGSLLIDVGRPEAVAVAAAAFF